MVKTCAATLASGEGDLHGVEQGRLRQAALGEEVAEGEADPFWGLASLGGDYGVSTVELQLQPWRPSAAWLGERERKERKDGGAEEGEGGVLGLGLLGLNLWRGGELYGSTSSHGKRIKR
jgi:hypothetical protein